MLRIGIWMTILADLTCQFRLPSEHVKYGITAFSLTIMVVGLYSNMLGKSSLWNKLLIVLVCMLIGIISVFTIWSSTYVLHDGGWESLILGILLVAMLPAPACLLVNRLVWK